MEKQLVNRNRIESIDILRGMVMVIMALDHVRDYFHAGSIAGLSPLDLETTTIPFFMTRWITHFCAPIFVFLSGTSIFLMSRKKDDRSFFIFLLTRGLFLIFLEFSVVTLGWTFNFQYSFFIFQVIGAIGLSMVCMAFITRLPFPMVVFLGLSILIFHNAFDRFDHLSDHPQYGFWISLLHKFKVFDVWPGHKVGIIYPFLPWLGIMLCGYGIGKFFLPHVTKEQRMRQLLGLGMVAVLVFFMLRWPNVYGDTQDWSIQKTGWQTALSFINTEKYPPSLLYALMTLGPALIFISLLEGLQNPITRFFLIFGRVPLFYYVLHIFLIHGLSEVWLHVSGMADSKEMGGSPFGLPADFGFGLPGTYLVWLVVVFLLYFPCKWYMKFKATHNYWWLSYL